MTLREQTLRKLAYEILSEIEKKEMELLSWGFYDACLDEASDLDIILSEPRLDTQTWKSIRETAQNLGLTQGEAINLLKKERLLIRPLGRPLSHLRSRFSETVRLLAKLRQRFSLKDWLSAPSLVLDILPQIAPRAYPARTVLPDEALEEIEKSGISLSPKEKEAMLCLTTSEEAIPLNLSRFQADSFSAILGGQWSSVFIGAGTGSGKTKAFYVPALTTIAPLVMEGQHWTKIIAVYPRKELLKDQFRECLSELSKLREGFYRDNLSLRVGAYYGDTPESHAALTNEHTRRNFNKSWKALDTANLICPLVRCPVSDCKGDLIWRIEDIRTQKDRLRCSSCGHIVWEDDIVLTREEMRERPPDILFTTTEMLNRLMGQKKAHRLIGISTEIKKRPRYMLLDEIHTYHGIHGAHVAYLLRRWKQAANPSKCVTVGLSATLKDARRFMSELTGTPEHQVGLIEPRPEDMIYEGMEYNLAVKGDPASVTALLSTSIQAIMLLARIMNPRHISPSPTPAAGKKVFAFADRLDTVSRWHSNLRDAEQKHLPELRKSLGSPNDDEIRDEQGQIWKVCEQIGHSLSDPLDIESISSLNPGLRASAQVVIATASLEVGYDDPDVGVILQHKSPRSQASFLQRKGRAGRMRTVRPWTVLILSDYGRDRWTFDHIEQVFSPVLPPLYLPLSNHYLQKIQAGFAFMDWLTLRGVITDSWQTLNGKGTRRDMENLRKFLDRVIQSPDSQETKALLSYLRTALQIDESAFTFVLWGEPRSFMLGFLPVLWRRLTSNWSNLSDIEAGDLRGKNFPMPDFLPSNLFSHLELPEVEIILPDTKDSYYLPVLSAMFEYAPGNVSKRFSPLTGLKTSHWLPVRSAVLEGVQHVDIDHFYPGSLSLVGHIKAGDQLIPFFYPHSVALQTVEDDVKESSSAHFDWESSFRASGGPPINLHLHIPAPLSRLLNSFSARLSRNGASLEVSRVAVSVGYDLIIDGRSYRGRLVFRRSDPPTERVGIGFRLDVDALGIRFIPPTSGEIRTFFSGEAGPSLSARFRPDYLKHLMQQSRILEASANRFAIEWLWRCELTALSSLALANNTNLAEAFEDLDSRGRSEEYSRVLRTIFRVQETQESDESRLKRKLDEIISSPGVTDEIAALSEKALLADFDESFFGWCFSRLISTLRAAVFAACQSLLPEADEEEITVDVEGGTIWISETAIGGVGLIEKLVDLVCDNPIAFFQLIKSSIRECPHDQISQQLNGFLEEMLRSQGPLREATESIQQGAMASLATAEKAREDLLSAAETLGLSTEREVVVAINSRLLRPGMTSKHRQLLHDLHRNWRKSNDALGICIDKRVFAYHALDLFDERMKDLWPDGYSRPQGFNIIENLLWSGCKDSCSFCLDSPQKFTEFSPPSRELLWLYLYPETSPLIWSKDSSFNKRVERELSEDGTIEINVGRADISAAKRWLLERLATPVEAAYQLYYPVITEVRRNGLSLCVTLSIMESYLG